MEDLVKVDRRFWSGKSVFVTGHTGFKGGWLSLWLQAMGARVTGFALPPQGERNLYETARVADGMQSVIGDIRSSDDLLAQLSRHRPDVVIHMAAQALVGQSFRSPVETFDVNVLGTVHLLEAVRKSGTARVVVNVTSDKCYENVERPTGYRETDRMGGSDPYSASKGCAELITASYRRSFFPDSAGVGIASARAGNVIGGGDWSADRLIPDIVRAIEQGQTALVRCPDAVRPWQHVLEPLSGYLMLAQKLWESPERFAGAWNFGPDDRDTKPVSWVADRLTASWGDGAAWRSTEDRRFPEAQVLRLDCAKARERLGWSPRWTLDQAIERVVAWHRGLGSGDRDMRDLTLAQVQDYEGACRD